MSDPNEISGIHINSIRCERFDEAEKFESDGEATKFLQELVIELANFVEYLAVASNDDGGYEEEIQRAIALINKVRGRK